MHPAQFSLAFFLGHWHLCLFSRLERALFRWSLSRLVTEFNLACTAADFSVWPWATGHMANVPGVSNHTLVNGRDLPKSIVVKTFY